MSHPTNKSDAATKLAHKRLSVLELAQQLGNVAEACRRSGMDRTSFYEYKRRFQTHGLEGLKDLPPIGSTAFGLLPTTKQPEAAVAVLHNAVLPCYAAHAILISSILTDNGRAFCGSETHAAARLRCAR